MELRKGDERREIFPRSAIQLSVASVVVPTLDPGAGKMHNRKVAQELGIGR